MKYLQVKYLAKEYQYTMSKENNYNCIMYYKLLTSLYIIISNL